MALTSASSSNPMSTPLSAAPQPRSLKPAKRLRNRATDIAVAVLLPWLVFFLALILFLFAYHSFVALVWASLGVCFGLAFIILAVGSIARHGPCIVIGFLCLISVVVGTLIGHVLYREYLIRYWELEDGVQYRNVNPTDLARETGDASVIHFSPDTIVDDRRTVGFVAQGSIYCVAPVTTPPIYEKEVHYWAVGEGCCEQRSNFDCGNARDSEATAAIVEKSSAIYSKAVSQAESVYGMNSTKNAQLVSFVPDPDVMISDIWDETLTIALVAMILDLVLCTVTGLVVAKVLIPAQKDPLSARAALIRK